MAQPFKEESGILISRINTLDQLKKFFFGIKMATILKYKHFFLKISTKMKLFYLKFSQHNTYKTWADNLLKRENFKRKKTLQRKE